MIKFELIADTLHSILLFCNSCIYVQYLNSISIQYKSYSTKRTMYACAMYKRLFEMSDAANRFPHIIKDIICTHPSYGKT